MWAGFAWASSPWAGMMAVVGAVPDPWTYNTIVVDSDFGYNPCGPTPQPAGAWLSDAFASPCIVVESGAR